MIQFWFSAILYLAALALSVLGFFVNQHNKGILALIVVAIAVVGIIVEYKKYKEGEEAKKQLNANTGTLKILRSDNENLVKRSLFKCWNSR